MAEEKKETEEAVKSTEAAAEGAPTVKKVSVKKKTSTKKAAKKKAVTKKAVEKKTETQASGAQPASKPMPPTISKAAESKSATSTGVVAASASSVTAAQPAQAKINVQVKPKKRESSEEPSMSTGAKSSSAFWVKVLFWLIILVLGFIYIRSLAKHPGEQGTANAVQTEMPAASSQSTAGRLAPVRSVNIAEKTPVEEKTQTGTKTDESSASAAPTANSVPAQDAAGSAKTYTYAQSGTAMRSAVEPSQAASSSAPQVAGSSDAATSGRSPVAGAGARESSRDLHEDSVSKILKEFDDLREATQAEMEAMRNLMQAERELREAMMVPPPAAYPPAWRGPAYSPYATGPQYAPYARP